MSAMLVPDMLGFETIEPIGPAIWPMTPPTVSMQGMSGCAYAVVPRDGAAIARGNNEVDHDARRCLCGAHDLAWRRDLQSWVCLWRRA